AALAGAALSFILNRFLYAPFQRKGTNLIGMVIISLAASLIIANILLAIAGYDTAAYEVDQGGLLRSNGLVLTTAQMAIIVVAVLLMLAIHALLRYTRLGKAMRATAANPTLARNCGIPTQQVIDVVWLLTGALCGVAGVVAGMNSENFSVASGAGYLITIIAAAVLGGAGQPYGAIDRKSVG